MAPTRQVCPVSPLLAGGRLPACPPARRPAQRNKYKVSSRFHAGHNRGFTDKNLYSLLSQTIEKKYMQWPEKLCGWIKKTLEDNFEHFLNYGKTMLLTVWS